MKHTVEIRPTAEDVAREAAAALAESIATAQQSRGTAHIVLTGGGIGTAVLTHLARLAIDWSRVELWWGDERFLPEGDPDRNATQAAAALLDHVSIPPTAVHAMPADEGQGADQAAQDYADELARSAPSGQVPHFDVLLLGVGPEGHVASIFPESPAVMAAAPVVAVHDSPKPPPTRVTLTLPTIRSAAQVWLVASGAEKAAAIAAALDPATDPVMLPAAGAVGTAGVTVWLDEPAAAQLSPSQKR